MDLKEEMLGNVGGKDRIVHLVREPKTQHKEVE